MDETKDQIENQIEDARGDLGANLQELERKVKSVTNWRTYYAKSPMTMIGVAFGAGVLVAAMTGNKQSRRRYPNAVNAGAHNLMSGGERQKNKATQTWENLKGALVGVAAARLKDYVGGIVPGFQDHYDRTQRENQAVGSEPALHPQRSM